MAVTAPIVFAGIGAAAGVAGAINAKKQGDDAADAAKKTAAANTKAAKNTLANSEEATNRANARAPDVSGIVSAAQQAAQGGAGSTMLTGPQGVDPNSLSLGKNTLLGA